MDESEVPTQPRGDASHLSSESTTQIHPATEQPATQPAALPCIDGYRMKGLLGRGGMGAVYLAEEIALDRLVAVKFIARRDDEATNRFRREARLLATIEHPNVVRIYSFGSTEHASYIVMEYIDGETLAQRISRQGALPIAEAIRIARQVVSALSAAATKNIVHRDIKPSNILLDGAGNVHVADFGLAKPMTGAADPITHAGIVVGTPHYLSPEQAEGGDVGVQSDIYALGVVLFEMVTGTRPFEASTPMAVIAKHLKEPMPSLTRMRRGVPRQLSSLVARMTRKSPADRPGSYDEIAPALENAAASRSRRISLMSVFAALGIATFLYVLFSFSHGVFLGVRETPQEALPRTSPAATQAPKPRTYDGELISLQLTDMELRHVLETFGKMTALNLAIDSDIPKESVTVSFRNVPWDAAFETILRQNRLTYSVDGNIVRIGRIARFLEEAEQFARLGQPPSNIGGSLPESASIAPAAAVSPKPAPAFRPPMMRPPATTTTTAAVAESPAIQPPALVAPPDGHTVADKAEVKLEWAAQPDASAYQLEVSRSRLFPGLEINARRAKTSATVRISSAGKFYWRVASIDASGRVGAFSAYRTIVAQQALTPAVPAPNP